MFRGGRRIGFVGTLCHHLDVGGRGERTAEMIDQLGKLAGLGIGTAICNVARIWDRRPIDIIGSEIIPAVATL